MAERPGVLIRFDCLEAVKLLPLEDAGRLFVSLLEYGKNGVEPDGFDGALKIVWSFLRPAIDADGKSYDEKVRQKQYAVYVREAKKQEQEIMSFDEWRTSSDTARYHSIPTDNQYNNNPIQSNNNINSIQEQVQGQYVAAKPPAPTNKAYGEYGWIWLSDKVYRDLIDDLGQSEVDRCIKYIDESAEATQNKNGWKNWNIVIRRCSREGWGRKEADTKEKPTKKWDLGIPAL